MADLVIIIPIAWCIFFLLGRLGNAELIEMEYDVELSPEEYYLVQEEEE